MASMFLQRQSHSMAHGRQLYAYLYMHVYYVVTDIPLAIVFSISNELYIVD